MHYTMEELVPIVGKLADQYTSCESTSITYEKADQLMEAVLYCIHELEQDGDNFAVSTDSISAQQAYETGFACVERKVKKALNLYNAVLPDFRHYENQCLYRSFVLELPHFFQRYDIRFAPQDTILILDYPVLKNISQYTGIDKIYAYIRCICLEQEFLGLFPVEYVTGVLSKYKDETDNLCEIVLVDVIRHILLKRPFNVSDWTKEDHIQIQAVLMGTVGHGERSALEEILASFVRKYCGGNVALLKYLLEDIRNIETRMKGTCG